MAVFKKTLEEQRRLDFRMLLSGAITFYRQKEKINHVANWFLLNNYVIFSFDCSEWLEPNDFHKEVSSKLSFPDYYGRNVNAFIDCIRDLEFPEEGGILFTFYNLDKFFIMNEDFCLSIFDAIELTSREHLMLGNRLISLAQLTNQNIVVSKIGCITPSWSIDYNE